MSSIPADGEHRLQESLEPTGLLSRKPEIFYGALAVFKGVKTCGHFSQSVIVSVTTIYSQY